MFRKIIPVILFLILLLVITGGGLLYYASIQIARLLTPERIVQILESHANVRAEIDRIDHNFFSSLAFVDLQGLRIGLRDKYAAKKTPLRDRPPMKSYFASVGSVRLSIAPSAILQGELKVTEFLIRNPELRVNIFPGGVTDIDPALEAPPESRESATIKKKGSEDSSLPVSLPSLLRYLPGGRLQDVGVEDAKVSLKIVRSGYRIMLDLKQAKIADLILNPRKLESENHARLKANGTLRVLSRFNNENITVHFSTDDTISPLLDPKTGSPNQKPELTALLHKGSRIQDFVLTDYIIRKVSSLQELGLVGQKLTGPVTATRNTPVRLQLSLEAVRIKNSPLLETDLFHLQLKKEGWIRLSDEEHLFQGSLFLLDEDSKLILDAVDVLMTPVRKLAPESAARIRTELLRDAMEEGRVRIRFKSEGNIEEPDLVILSPLPSSERLAEAIERDPDIKETKELIKEISNKVEKVATEQGNKILEEVDKISNEEGKELLNRIEETVQEGADEVIGEETGRTIQEKARKLLNSIPDSFFGSDEEEKPAEGDSSVSTENGKDLSE